MLHAFQERAAFIKMSYKYTTRFSESILASSDIETGELNISKASLAPLKPLIPSEVDLDKNIDLMAVAFNAAVVNKFNRNGDGIDSATANAINKYFIHKPTNIEHIKNKVVGHIVSAGFSSYGSNEMIENVSEVVDPFNIALGAVVYRTVNPAFANMIEMSNDAESDYHQAVSASWEIGFNEYVIALGSDNLKEAELVTDKTQIEELKGYLKAMDGPGQMDDGTKVYRLVTRNIYPLGIGFTTNPAADVKGLIMEEPTAKTVTFKEKRREASMPISVNNEEFLDKLQNFSSHSNKNTVKPIKDVKIMETQKLIDKLESLLTQEVEKNDFSPQEAVASIGSVVSEAIREKNEEYKQQLADAETEKEKLLEAQAELETSVQGLKEQLASTQEQLQTLESANQERAAQELFNARMDKVNEEYDLSDEDRQILASEVKDLDSSEESFDSYQEKLSVVWKHKNKAHLEELEKQMNEKIEEQVQKRLAELQASDVSVASEEVQPEAAAEEQTEEVVEEVLEKTEAEEQLPNNNVEVAEAEPTLREKFQNAFLKENITIKY